METCLQCQSMLDSDNTYCSKECNEKYYRSQHLEHRRFLLREWRKKNKQPIIATCVTCSKQFQSTRKISKDCSSECNNKRRVLERKNRSLERREKDYELYRKRYLKMRENINRRLKTDLRSRLNRALKGNFKVGSAIQDLGCSVAELKHFLEERFYPNPETGEVMNWNNKGLYGWHIDHIIPLSSFNLSNREEFLKACHYTNLQPLWAKDNLVKKDK